MESSTSTARAGDADADLRERLHSALWLHVGRLVDEETLNLRVNATPQFIGALTELVWNQIQGSALDCEMFARHAGRKTINTDDVLLLSRRNEGLASILQDFVDRMNSKKL